MNDCALSPEIWKPIPGYKRYYKISNHGRVKSIPRKVKVITPGKKSWHRKFPGVIIKGRANHCGHVGVILFKNGHGRYRFIHSLVLIAFVGPKPKGTQCCHWDGNPSNNTISNLRWGTPKDNSLDKQRHNTMIKGEKHSQAKLTERDILEIRRLYSEEKTSKSQLATRYKVSWQAIYLIVNRRRWKHI